MWEGTTSRVMGAERPCGEFMIFTASVRNILDTTSYYSEIACSNGQKRIEAVDLQTNFRAEDPHKNGRNHFPTNRQKTTVTVILVVPTATPKVTFHAGL
jgi:hypothetical protein